MTSAVYPGEPINLTPQNWKQVTRHVPHMMRQALKLVLHVQIGTLQVDTPHGSFVVKGKHPGKHAVMVIHDYRFARRAVRRGQIGVAESYVEGEWSTPNLTEFLQLFCENWTIIQTFIGDRVFVRAWLRFRHWMNRNTRRGSKRNILAHYDLGNDFYKAWLDPSMTYSSAIFDGANDLETAQKRKYELLAERISLKDGDDVLEIGCGWGGFAEYAAKAYDCKITGVTISQEQHDYARQRIFEAGLSEKVDIRLQDYRDIEGQFDKIASIEMFEAVGEEYWDAYFNKVSTSLKPGGKAGLQVIFIQDEMFEPYRLFSPDFIQKHIFPGGMLPCPSIMQKLGDRFGLTLEETPSFRISYADTLLHWRERFLDGWPHISELGFDDRFRRIWEYYLCYCEAGFRAGNVDVRQFVYAK